MAINWKIELPAIEKTAAIYGLDPLFIAAIRKQENGAAGREFGVLSESATSYDAQLADCCATVRNRLCGFAGNPFSLMSGSLVRRLIYSMPFINWFAYGDETHSGWCPKGAENDPNNLNQYWARNVTAFYIEWAKTGNVTS